MYENLIRYDKINFVVGPDKTWYTWVKSRLDGFLLEKQKNVHKFEGPLPSVPGGGGIRGQNFPSTINNDATGEVQPKLTLTREGGVLSYIGEL